MICRANQWTGFYMIWTVVMKELNSLSFHWLLRLLHTAGCNILEWEITFARITCTKKSLNDNFILLQLRPTYFVWVLGSSFFRYRNTLENRDDARSQQGRSAYNAGFEIEDAHKPAGKIVKKLTSVTHIHVAVTGCHLNVGFINGFFLFRKDC